MHVCLQCRGITKAREKKKEREMRIDILFFYSITCMHKTTIRTHYTKIRIQIRLIFIYFSFIDISFNSIDNKWLIQYVDNLLRMNKVVVCLFVFYLRLQQQQHHDQEIHLIVQLNLNLNAMVRIS